MFYVGPTKTHGLGWIASLDIPANTPILDEELLLRLPIDSLDTPSLVDAAISQLGTRDREAFLDLHGRSVVEKLCTNGSPLIDIGADPLGIQCRSHVGIYLQCARLNHSCRPNSARVVEQAYIMSVVAKKDIAKGEEITISYLEDNLLVAKERHRALLSKTPPDDNTWSRGCHCELCTGPESLKRASDERRMNLFSLRERLLQGALSNTLLTRFLELMEEEGLYTALMGTFATIKIMQQLGISSPSTPNHLHSITFPPGTKVVLLKLRARPELNGQTGVVVSGFDSKSGRVGVRLDHADSMAKLIAVKAENLFTV